MIARALTLAIGITGAAGMSQFPEYSQQYLQRLAGSVEELGRIVEDFDRSAKAEGLTRDEALASMTGSSFVERRRTDMSRAIARHERLSADLQALRGAGPFTRAYQVARFDDADLMRGTAEDFRPALPLTFEGAVFAGAGLVIGLLVAGLLGDLLRLLSAPFRRRPA
ncbi:DUF2937 family protein [Pseudooceanicola sp. MF1-13]|uniref:DUF2937 family protein n=1 Tax=Pseudooceanicola sp. MF1-13 TaxID=3379095 RepID=UPI003892B23D